MYKIKNMSQSLVHSTKILTNFKIDPHQTAYYDIVIQVDTFVDDGVLNAKEYYEILYSFSFHPPPDYTQELDALKAALHPFRLVSEYESSDTRQNQYLGIMLKNTFTAQLVDYLLMDNETLALNSGSISPEEYRNGLMWSISYFAKEMPNKHKKLMNNI